MQKEPQPSIRWDQTCDGSACALVIFVGPSPGGAKQSDRPPLKIACTDALWDQVYDAPLSWSRGFRTSFQPLVEALFGIPYSSAGKLIGRANMDWISNPESDDVAVRYMWEGRHSVLKMLREAQPELVIAMDEKTCEVLEIALHDAGVEISSVHPKQFAVRISSAERLRLHRGLQAFRARIPNGHEFVVMKALQHPARMFNSEYAKRCGEALREAAMQIAAGKAVDVTRA
jgi:hypothetical protein